MSTTLTEENIKKFISTEFKNPSYSGLELLNLDELLAKLANPDILRLCVHFNIDPIGKSKEDLVKYIIGALPKPKKSTPILRNVLTPNLTHPSLIPGKAEDSHVRQHIPTSF
jgi:hypothetical protein